MKKLLLTLAGVLFLIWGTGAALADASGKAEGVNPQADALSGAITRTLEVGADIFIGDKIDTGAEGLVQIRFADNTELVIGPNSSLVIDDYLIRNNGSAGKIAVDMLSGSFRFVTGTSPKSAYQINTPTGTIGVRGTAFDVFVDEDTGIAYVLMYRGETLLTENGDQTEFLSGLCHVGVIDIDDTLIIGDADTIEGEERDVFKQHFLFSINQSQLLASFRLPNAGECTRRSPQGGAAGSSVTSSGPGNGDSCPPHQHIEYGEGGAYCEWDEGWYPD